MKFIKIFKLIAVYLLIASFLSACASTGPKISKADRELKEEEFNRRFFEVSGKFLPRIHRIGYQLVTSPVPDHGNSEPKFEFIGVGVEELKKPTRKSFAIPESINGVLVTGTYPGSKAEGIDLRVGDVIQKVNEKKTKNLGAYFKRVRKAEGKTVKLEVNRKGEVLTYEVPLEKVYYNALFFLGATPNLDAHAAFSKITIGIGAIRYCKNDDELATIMGHELAHVTLKHSLKTIGTGMSTAIAYGAVAGVIDAFTLPGLGGLITGPIEQATDAVVSRRYEREADYFGMKHAFHSGYDVENGSNVFGRLATDAPGFTLLAYTFSSHPKTSERALRLEKIIEEFKTQYPSKFPLEKHPDWDVVIPVELGETMEVALQKLLQEKKLDDPNAPKSVPDQKQVPVPSPKLATTR